CAATDEQNAAFVKAFDEGIVRAVQKNDGKELNEEKARLFFKAIASDDQNGISDAQRELCADLGAGKQQNIIDDNNQTGWGAIIAGVVATLATPPLISVPVVAASALTLWRAGKNVEEAKEQLQPLKYVMEASRLVAEAIA